MTGLHQEVTLSFMLSGHTKFSPDWSFGLLKQRFRREIVSCLDDLASTVDASAQHNIPQLCGREDGTVFVNTYDWTAYLRPHFRRIKNVKQYHHFTISADSPGSVTLKMYADSSEETITLLKDEWQPQSDLLPPVISPPGLSPERQWYLYDHIRDYCTPSTRDIVCPLPSIPRPGTAHQHPVSPPSSFLPFQPPQSVPSQPQPSLPPPSPSQPPPPKRPRLCSVCGRTGHNARSHSRQFT